MKPDTRFQNQTKEFWANVRSISQAAGYVERGTRKVKIYTPERMAQVMRDLNLDTLHLQQSDGAPTVLGERLVQYFEYRARVLNTFVEPHLMDVTRAAATYDELRRQLDWTLPVPMNKQKGNMKAPAYLTAITNMLIEANKREAPCDYNPRVLTTVTRGGAPLRTLARRIDGCFPGTVNPIAVWEIKEYYYTTTFGSRVADGIYESLLDGYELEEIREELGVDIKHVLMVDAHDTWWNKGRSYLCRLIDILHMGYVDEVLFGYEVVEELPAMVRGWLETYRARHSSKLSEPEGPP